MKICVFKTNPMHSQFSNVHIRLDLLPELSKTKILKFILDIDDVK